jgi:arylsulfatase A-like enzyme
MYWNFRKGSHLGVRKGGWKLISTKSEGERTTQLFDVAADPYERNELSGDAPDIVEELSGLIREQRALDDTSKRDDVESSMVP